MHFKNLHSIFLVLGIMLCASGVFAQWSAYAPMPGTRWAHVTAAASGRLYVAGGSTGPTWEYNPVTNSWATMASIPTQRSYPAVASWNGLIYVLGGSQGAVHSTQNERYDPATNTWVTLTNMPQARTTTAAAAINGRIYVVNGWNGTAMTAVDVYDIATDAWLTGTAAPTGRSHAKTAVVNNRLYLLGGYAGGWTNINEVYDPATNLWTTLAPMPTARYIHAVGEIGTTIFVAGGYSGSATNVFESYNPVSNTWTTEAAMPTARYRTDGASVNGCFYVLGGYNGSNLNTNEGFCSTILPLEINLLARPGKNSVELIWQDLQADEAALYAIERADLEGEFVEIGQVNPNALQGIGQRFVDQLPLYGTHLYRLRRLGFNGESAYTASIAVEFAGEPGIQFGWHSTQQTLDMEWGSEMAIENGNLRIVDMQGREVLHTAFTGSSITERKLSFDLELLSRGIYLISVRTESGFMVNRKLGLW